MKILRKSYINKIYIFTKKINYEYILNYFLPEWHALKSEQTIRKEEFIPKADAILKDYNAYLLDNWNTGIKEKFKNYLNDINESVTFCGEGLHLSLRLVDSFEAVGIGIDYNPKYLLNFLKQ
ncbi:MAG: hypothetical protein JXA66_06810 [Oligoflexia bacterium]|nr:hypothetical protein [Oligoflexia bacterium]